MTDMNLSFEAFFGGGWESVAVTAARVALILVVAFIVSRVLRRAIRRLAGRMARRHEKRQSQEERDEECALDQRLEALRDKLVDIIPPSQRRERAAQRAKTMGSTAASVVSFIIWFIALMLVLAEIGISLGPILAGAGIVGVALGFGAQSMVRDFLAGIFIVVEDQYGVGDIIDVGEARGMVEEVTLRRTRLRGLDGTMWHVPNGEIKRAGNMSQYWARVILDVPIAYDADVNEASAVIKQVADDIWRDHENTDILEEPEVWGVEEFGNDSIAIRLVVKTLPSTQFQVARVIRGKIKEAFDREGFEIPFPQRTVWLKK